MYTADDAREEDSKLLDNQIKLAVEGSDRKGTRATMRVTPQDWFRETVEYQLEVRGFKNVCVCGVSQGNLVVQFEW